MDTRVSLDETLFGIWLFLSKRNYVQRRQNFPLAALITRLVTGYEQPTGNSTEFRLAENSLLLFYPEVNWVACSLVRTHVHMLTHQLLAFSTDFHRPATLVKMLPRIDWGLYGNGFGLFHSDSWLNRLRCMRWEPITIACNRASPELVETVRMGGYTVSKPWIFLSIRPSSR